MSPNRATTCRPTRRTAPGRTSGGLNAVASLVPFIGEAFAAVGYGGGRPRQTTTVEIVRHVAPHQVGYAGSSASTHRRVFLRLDQPSQR